MKISNKLFGLFGIIFLLFFLSSCNKKENIDLPEGENVFFQLTNNQYVSSKQSNQNILFANNTGGGYVRETFKIKKKERFVRIKNSLNYFISYNNSDSILMGFEKEAGTTGSFILTPHKEYFELHTIGGGNVIIDEYLQLKVSYTKPAVVFKIISATPEQIITSLSDIVWWRFFFQLLLFIGIIYLFFKFFKNKILNNRFSFKTVLILGFIWAYVVVNTKEWQYNRVIVNDTIEYYEYLPAAIIFNDLSFDYINKWPKDFNGTIWVRVNEKTGRGIPRFTMGLSIMYLPFFLAGHSAAHILNYSTYGYSQPYFIFICLASWFYAFLGLFYLRKILLTYFNDIVTTFTLVSIALATNLFYYVIIEGAMTHGYSFFLFTLFIWQTIKWNKNKKLKTAIFLGLTLGLIALIRPTNALLLLVFVLYDVTGVKSLKDRIKLFWTFKNQLLIIALFSIIVWVPQLIFWKYAANEWFHFSYGEENKFYFANPHILEGLFSYRKGWLLYTPIMSFAVLGIFFLFKHQKKWAFPILIFTIINIYVMFSWWCWWYGGSFGCRPMIESYALLAIPLGMFYSSFDKKIYLRSIPLFIIFLTTSLNLFQTLQTKTCLHYDSMAKEAYWANFTKLGWEKGYNDLIKPPDYRKAQKGEEEYKFTVY